MKYHVSFGFKKLKDAELMVAARGVKDALVKNSGQFPALPVSPAALQTGTDDFSHRLGAAYQGGVAQTLAKNNARAALLDQLDTLARYVEGVALGDPEVIRAAGFDVKAHVHTPQTPLAKPSEISALNVASTKVQLRMQAQRNVRSVRAQYRTTDGNWQDGGVFLNTKVVVVSNLVPGTQYVFRLQFIGGSTGTSEWSDPLSHMAI